MSKSHVTAPSWRTPFLAIDTDGALKKIRALALPTLRMFGAKGDGVTDDTDAVQAAFDYVKANGGILVDDGGTYAISYVSLTGSAAAWTFRGAGKGRTKFVRNDNEANSVIGSSSSSYPFTLESFSVDANHSGASSGNHGISIANMSGLVLRDIAVSDYKNTGILVYGTASHTYSRNFIIDCEVDGLSASNNGMLIADMDQSGFARCFAKDCDGSPGYGVQLKNACDYCFITDCHAEGCVAGIAFGNDSAATGVRYAKVKGCSAYNCTQGFLSSYAYRNVIDGLIIDGNDIAGYQVRFETTSIGNVMRGLIVQNVNAARSAIRFLSGATDNSVWIDALDEIDTSGIVVEFDSGSERNRVELSKMTNPTIRSGGLTSMVDFNGTTTNSFVYDPYPTFENQTIATGVVTLNNEATTMVVVDTEAAAATDDLDTITGINREGALLTIRAANGARDVVVKHLTGNIALNGSADFTLNNANDTVTLRYNAGSPAWCEVGRGNNGG